MDAVKGTIDTDRFSDVLRSRLIDGQGNVLISSLDGSEQAADLTEPTNCDGLGRVRHFHRATSPGWPSNPLPIDPAIAALSIEPTDIMTSEIFQLAGCNWRCWYCYVPFNLLSANEKSSRWIAPAELVRLYARLPQRPPILVLSGGQPDLVPEWIPATMRALAEQGLDEVTYLWSDDNLSNDFLWKYLSHADFETIRKYRNYGRVGCFKGFDPHSFAFNTKADSSLFDRQFELFLRLLDTGINVFGYATFTSDCADRIDDHVAAFVDRLQTISRLLPLRIIPLEVREFTPVKGRISVDRMSNALAIQERAISAWNDTLRARFNLEELERNIVDVVL